MSFWHKLFQVLFPASILVQVYGPQEAFGPPRPTPAEKISPDVDVLARTIWGEARGQNYVGMQAVANVIINRRNYVRKYPWYAVRWGSGIAGICKWPWQFSVWNKSDPNYQKIQAVTDSDPQFRTALEIAQKAADGTLVDITDGSTYYHTKAILPKWAENAVATATIGTHKFYKPENVA